MTSMTTWTEEQAVEFGRASARTAIDQRSAYASLDEAVDNYRDNLCDTLVEYHASQHEPEAVRAFDMVLTEHRAANRKTYEDLTEADKLLIRVASVIAKKYDAAFSDPEFAKVTLWISKNYTDEAITAVVRDTKGE